MPEDSYSNDANKSKQELQTELRLLRQKIADMEVKACRKNLLEEVLCRDIKLGFWEWEWIDGISRPSYLSEQFARIFGMDRDEMYKVYKREEDLYPFVHPEDMDAFIQYVNMHDHNERDSDQATVFNYRIVLPSGEIRHIRELQYGIDLENGAPVHSYGAVQDITELKEIEESLRETKLSLESVVEDRTGELAETIKQLKQEMLVREKVSIELESKNAELERFTYTVSHDLKSPLVTIKGFIGLLGQDIEANDQIRVASDIEKIGNAADTMDLLLNDLLELSRVGRVMGEPRLCNLSEIANEAKKLVETKTDDYEVEIIIDEMPDVKGDQTRLIEIYLNLLTNAIKFMGDQKLPGVHIGAEEIDGMIRCSVRDNGMGIAEQYREQIFGLFERLNTGVAGTGVGLALVKRIIEVHGGEVWAESDGLGHGTTIIFTLPKS